MTSMGLRIPLLLAALAIAFALPSRAAAASLSGEYTCLTYGASINWFQNLVFWPNGHYALGTTQKPYGQGQYTLDSRHIVHFLSGGDDKFLGLLQNGNIYLKFKTDNGPFIKRGFDLTFKCGRNSRQ